MSDDEDNKSIGSDDESDFSDDEFAEQYKQQRMIEMKTAVVENDNGVEIPSGTLHEIAQSFVGDSKNCILNYVQRGSEINEQLRKGEIKSVKCLDQYAKPLKNWLSNDNYVILYRAMTQMYDEGKISGYISSSNKYIKGFGRYCMKIYVPTETPVLVADISGETGLAKTFEIILPRGTVLKYFGDNEDDCGVYLSIYKTKPSDAILRTIKREVVN